MSRLMFIPSESVSPICMSASTTSCRKRYRARVIIVSPSLMMLAIQVVQQIQKDAACARRPTRFATKSAMMIEDVQRAKERVENLNTHFGHVNKDIEQIVTSAEKIEKRGEKIRRARFRGRRSAERADHPGADASASWKPANSA